MQERTLSALPQVSAKQPNGAPPVHFFYPSEGFGNVYRRSMLNDFFTELIVRTNIRSVAEVPVECYGIVGAGSLIFTQLGCEITLVSEDQLALDRAQALMHFNGVPQVRYLHSPLHNIPVAADTFDLTWNFDEILTMPDKETFLQELCRISKATFVVVPNANSYGQLMHHWYHKFTGTTCMHAGPRPWMHPEPIANALKNAGMDIVDVGFIDVPWWPSFPELPNMVRRMLGRAPVEVTGQGIPEANPDYVRPADVPAMRRKVERSAFIEHGRWWPRPIRQLFAHNIYVLGCKPAYRHSLGL